VAALGEGLELRGDGERGDGDDGGGGGCVDGLVYREEARGAHGERLDVLVRGEGLYDLYGGGAEREEVRVGVCDGGGGVGELDKGPRLVEDGQREARGDRDQARGGRGGGLGGRAR
jgi:hypothetical protein